MEKRKIAISKSIRCPIDKTDNQRLFNKENETKNHFDKKRNNPDSLVPRLEARLTYIEPKNEAKLRIPLEDVDNNARQTTQTSHRILATVKRQPLVGKKLKLSTELRVTLRSDTANKKKLDIPNEVIEIDSSDDDVFLHCPQEKKIKITADTKKQLSPIRPNVYIPRDTIISEGIPARVKQLQRKTTLSTTTVYGNSSAYCLDIYSTEYLKDIIQNQLVIEGDYVIKTNDLKNHNCTEHNRALVINWIIKTHNYLSLSPIILFATIRLFDVVLSSTTVAPNMYQLISLVILGIVIKYEDRNYRVLATKMLTLCSNVYSKHQFLKMEQKLLNFFNFTLQVPDITLNVAYYLKELNKENELLENCAHYILECYVFNINFSTVLVSVQAAAAVCLTVKLLFPTLNVWNTLRNKIGFYKLEELKELMNVMLEQVQKVQDPEYKFRQPFEKYQTKEKSRASIVLLKHLIAS